jgi:tetratricopeptide (TPR) repeat protein
MYLAKGILAGTLKNWDEAESCFEQAVQINHQFEMPWDEAKTLYEWGLMHLARNQAGDRESALEKLESALEIFERIGAKKDLEKVLTKKELLVK